MKSFTCIILEKIEEKCRSIDEFAAMSARSGLGGTITKNAVYGAAGDLIDILKQAAENGLVGQADKEQIAKTAGKIQAIHRRNTDVHKLACSLSLVGQPAQNIAVPVVASPAGYDRMLD